MRRLFQIAAILIVLSVPAWAQQGTDCENPPDFNAWLNCEIYRVVQARLNQKDASKQAEASSIAANSTTFVDQTSGPDLISLAYGLAGLQGNGGDDGSSGPSVTASAYALYAAVSDVDPLNPTFYNSGRAWRRISVTLGQDFPEEDGSGGRADVYGFRVLLQDQRDASNWIGEMGDINAALATSAQAFSRLSSDIQDFLFAQLAPNLGLSDDAAGKATFITTYLDTQRFASLLNEDQVRQMSELVEERIAPFLVASEETRKFVNEKKSAPQLSIAGLAKQRGEMEADEHRLELIYDRGLFGPASVVLNGSFDYVDSKEIGGDSRGGRAAAALRLRVTPDNPFMGTSPVLLTFAAEGRWMSNTPDRYQVQAQLRVPVPGLAGVELPISFGWENRTETRDRSSLNGQLGFTFDFARLVQGVK